MTTSAHNLGEVRAQPGRLWHGASRAASTRRGRPARMARLAA